MKIYYIFKIKNDFYDLYKDYPNALYNLFLEIYELKKHEIDYGLNLFNQISTSFNKKRLDNKITSLLSDKLRYSKNKDEHIINNIFKEEVSIMKIKNTHIVINTISANTEFFEILEKNDKNLFACDFKNNDYFFLSRIKTLV